ncbi:hypothetical protein P280DRAFT_547737 [Massarina eburnea CBS 473.64]|uniref:C3H1-type domain-containing protein n=1 Tax=Massarina eburnea CBS 473.64 TaxID=1395130 RepID=A0A6A6SBR6_9PLEO|nr:hypothetical protein P280DRAFT_547737 [Massarina eburnea CBS 473.64]
MAIYNQSSNSEDTLRYYILRKPGYEMIPLIPVDQLPFQVQGVPRQLSHRQLSDEGWKYLDETSKPATVLPVIAPSQTLASPSPTTVPRFRAPDHHVREVSSELDEAPKSDKTRMMPLPINTHPLTSTTEAITPTHRPAISSPSNRGQSLADDVAAIYSKDAQKLGYNKPYPSGTAPDPSKKVYCSHWIRTGECDFMAQGCKYKHVMPPIDVLRDIGLPSEPRWYKDKQILNTRTWLQRKAKQEREDEESDGNTKNDSPKDPNQMRDARLEAIFKTRMATGVKTVDDEHKPPSKETQPQRTPSNHHLPTQDKPPPAIENFIDFDAPARPSSPQPSHYSTSSQTSTPSLASTTASPPPPPIPPTTTTPPPTPKTTDKRPQPSLRRHSEMSWSSADEAVKAWKQQQQQASRRKVYPKKKPNDNNRTTHHSTIPTTPSTPTPTPAKKPHTNTPNTPSGGGGGGGSNGLAKSRYAPTLAPSIKTKERNPSSTNTHASQRNTRLLLKNLGASDAKAPDFQVQVIERTRGLRQARGSREGASAGVRARARARASASVERGSVNVNVPSLI